MQEEGKLEMTIVKIIHTIIAIIVGCKFHAEHDILSSVIVGYVGAGALVFGALFLLGLSLEAYDRQQQKYEKRKDDEV